MNWIVVQMNSIDAQRLVQAKQASAILKWKEDLQKKSSVSEGATTMPCQRLAKKLNPENVDKTA
jgi:hypothetical protein